MWLHADCLAAERRRTTAADNIQRETTTILLHIITSNGRHFMFCICLARRHCMLFQNSLQSLRFHLSLFSSIFIRFVFIQLNCCGSVSVCIFFLGKPTNQTPSCEIFTGKGNPLMDYCHKRNENVSRRTTAHQTAAAQWR